MSYVIMKMKEIMYRLNDIVYKTSRCILGTRYVVWCAVLPPLLLSRGFCTNQNVTFVSGRQESYHISTATTVLSVGGCRAEAYLK